MAKSNRKFQNVPKKCPQKSGCRNITHFIVKAALHFAKILPKIRFFYTNIVGTLVRFSISDAHLRE
jgi:hypothetical protein